MVDDTVQEMVEYLKGSCNSMEHALDLFEIPDNREMIAITIEEQIELCEHCEWWHEVDEMHDMDGDRVCDDCWQQSTEDGEAE